MTRHLVSDDLCTVLHVSHIPIGAVLHRIGGVSFPTKSATRSSVAGGSLDECIVDSGMECSGMEHAESAATRERLVEMEIKDILRTHVAAINTERAAAITASHEEEEIRLKSLCRTAVAAAKDPDLARVGAWVQEVATCDACALVFDAVSCCSTGGQDSKPASIAQLSREWTEQHRGLPRGPPRKVTGVRESTCCKAGTCICHKSAQGVLTKNLWQAAEKTLKCLLKPQQAALLGGEVVLFWFSRGVGDRIVDIKTTHVSCMYLSPWRPTFLRLAPDKPLDCDTLKEFLLQHRDRTCKARYVNMHVMEVDDTPNFETQYSFMKLFNGEGDWSVTYGILSQRQTPCVASQTVVQVELSDEVEKLLWWSAEQQRRTSREQFHLLRENNGSEPETQPESEPQHFDSGEVDEQDEEEQGTTEERDPDEDINFSEDLMQLLVEAPYSRATSHNKTPSKRSSRSTSSSSNNSSSSSSSPEERTPTEPVATSALAATSGGDDSHAKPRAAKATTRDASHTVQWGDHSYVQRFTNGVLTGYQMTCHHHTKCSKELSFNVAGSESKARHMLKAWIILGLGLPDRESHMKPDVKAMLQEALENGLLLEESLLDKCVSLNHSRWCSPFTINWRQQCEGKLGKKAKDVPEHVHKQMEELVRQNKIVATTPAQRLRNRRTHNTDYGVPQTLKEGLVWGYISPNLAPPQGMIWRAVAGSWRLSHRGG
eukprot:6492685-Amphidinium_carterae.9